MKARAVKTLKAAAGNKKLADFEELRDVVIGHREKTKSLQYAGSFMLDLSADNKIIRDYVE